VVGPAPGLTPLATMTTHLNVSQVTVDTGDRCEQQGEQLPLLPLRLILLRGGGDTRQADDICAIYIEGI